MYNSNVKYIIIRIVEQLKFGKIGNEIRIYDD